MLRDSAVVTATIANGATTSSAISVRSYSLFQLLLPAAFTGTTITFTTSGDYAGTYQALYDNTGTAVSLTVAAGRNLDLPSALASSAFFKIVSGSAEGAARTLSIVCKG
jgi:hypothetical protein